MESVEASPDGINAEILNQLEIIGSRNWFVAQGYDEQINRYLKLTVKNPDSSRPINQFWSGFQEMASNTGLREALVNIYWSAIGKGDWIRDET